LPPPSPIAGDERLVAVSRLTRLLRRPELGALMGAVAIWLLFTAVDSSSGHLWVKQPGLAAWTQQAAFFGILAVPVGLLMIGGEFDLSTGVMGGVTAIIPALLISKYHWAAWPAILAAFVFAALIGFINGYLVVKTRLPSFIVTLATFFVLRGATTGELLHLTHSTQISVINPQSVPGLHLAHTLFGSSFLSSHALQSGYSTGIIWFIIVTIVATWVLTRTTFGNWIFAAGGEANAARNSGVPVERTKIILFMSTALAAALVGVINFTAANSAVSEQGVGYEFYYIIAAVVGGCFLTGGYGSAVGAALGACIIGMATEGVIYASWDSSWGFAFLGGILFLAVIVNTVIYRRALSARR
jgi:simple sugar transport system permease protein